MSYGTKVTVTEGIRDTSEQTWVIIFLVNVLSNENSHGQWNQSLLIWRLREHLQSASKNTIYLKSLDFFDF